MSICPVSARMNSCWQPRYLLAGKDQHRSIQGSETKAWPAMPNTALLACLLTFASQACYWEASVAAQAIPAPRPLNSEV